MKDRRKEAEVEIMKGLLQISENFRQKLGQPNNRVDILGQQQEQQQGNLKTNINNLRTNLEQLQKNLKTSLEQE